MTEQTAALRGARLRQMREVLGLTQQALMDRMNTVAASIGLSRRYEGNDISTRENGRRDLDAEDYAVLACLDPKQWSWMWFAFGEDLKAKARVPLPRPSQASGGGR